MTMAFRAGWAHRLFFQLLARTLSFGVFAVPRRAIGIHFASAALEWLSFLWYVGRVGRI